MKTRDSTYGPKTLCTVGRVFVFFFFQAEDGIRDIGVTGVQTCALPICETVSLVSLIDRSPLRAAVDQGYKGHRLTGHPHTAVYITGQKRGVTDQIKRWLDRKSVV